MARKGAKQQSSKEIGSLNFCCFVPLRDQKYTS
jgi:hypothetical protein